MKQNDLHRLSKGELIDIIYEQKKVELELEARLQSLQNDSTGRQLKVENAGSLAEAALGVNKVFETAQKAADDYVRQIHNDYSAIERRCDELIKQTEEKCQKREAEADRKVGERWAAFNRKAQEYIKAREELLSLLPPDFFKQ